MTRKFFAVIICIFLLFTLSGCFGTASNDIPTDTLIRFLCGKYGGEFSLIGTEETTKGNGTDTLYTFENADGITCHIEKKYGGGYLGVKYSYREDYQVAYLRAHPELTEALYDGWFCERVDDDDGIFLSTYTLYLVSYGSIEPTLRFIDEFIGNAAPVPDNEYDLGEYEILSLPAKISVAPSDKSDFYLYYYYPTSTVSSNQSVETLISKVQEKYEQWQLKDEQRDF